MVGSLPDIEGLAPDDLKRLVLQLVEEVGALKETVAALRDEIARLKGLNGRPPIKPSGMEGSSGAKRAGRRKTKRRGKGSKRLIIDEDRIVAAAVAPGSRFKGYEDYVVQDLVVRRHVVRFRRERRLMPGGTTVVAPLPPGIVGHFGAELRRFVLAQYHRGQVTVPRLVAQLDDLGIAISKRQVVRLLTDLSLPLIPSALSTAVRLSGTDIILSCWISKSTTGQHHRALSAGSYRRTPCKSMQMLAASTSPRRDVDRSPAVVVRPRDARNDDADRRPGARKRPSRNRPAERVVHPVCPCRATSGSSNRDNSRGTSQECAANAAHRG